jgi:hypothetical protein
MLQKIVNGIAIASGVISLTVVGTVGYVFIRKDAIIENVKGKIMESVMPGGMSGILGEGAGTGALEGLAGGGLGLPSPSDPTPANPQSPIPLGF